MGRLLWVCYCLSVAVSVALSWALWISCYAGWLLQVYCCGLFAASRSLWVGCYVNLLGSEGKYNIHLKTVFKAPGGNLIRPSPLTD